MDLRSEQLLSSELQRDEKLLWSGKPDPKRLALRAMPIFFFAIPWTAFAVFWVCMAWLGLSHAKKAEVGPMAFFPLFGLPFVLLGLALLCAPWSAYASGKRIHYAVTSKRLLIVTSGRSKSVVAFDRSELGAISRRDYGRKGDITWQANAAVSGQICGRPFSIQSRGMTTTTTQQAIGFFGIDNPQEVQRLIES